MSAPSPSASSTGPRAAGASTVSAGGAGSSAAPSSQLRAWFDPEVIEELRKAFDAADLDGSGTIDVHEACVLFARQANPYFPVGEDIPVTDESYKLASRMLQQMNVRDGKITFEQFCFRFGRKLQQDRNRERRSLSLAEGEVPFVIRSGGAGGGLGSSSSTLSEGGARTANGADSSTSRERAAQSGDAGAVEPPRSSGAEAQEEAGTRPGGTPSPSASILPTAVNRHLVPVLDQILAQVNEVRQSTVGATPIALHYHLTKQALKHATEVASGVQNFSHENAEDRIFACGFFEGIGENLARLDNYSLPAVAEGCVRGWCDSEGHLRNMQLREFNVCGIGVGVRESSSPPSNAAAPLSTTFVTMLFAIESDAAREANCRARTAIVNGSVVREAERESTVLTGGARELWDSCDVALRSVGNAAGAARISAAEVLQYAENDDDEAPVEGSDSSGRNSSAGRSGPFRTNTSRGVPSAGTPSFQTASPPENASQRTAGSRSGASVWDSFFNQCSQLLEDFRQPLMFLLAWFLAFSFLHYGGHDLRNAPELIRRVEEIYKKLLYYFPAPAPGGSSAGHNGNPECWGGDFNFATCCLPLGAGNAACWDTHYTYARCCNEP
eukprot:CAMPEP_0178989126 /NCGR_PEP_ID=MMETSP0795-20121207/4188_1 /TAXON_ID=88552 /ORGANISM="Amoebophrya sp., Strain Ameob2" /LENGTH=611 /DNA_ID=CAMNT_0020680467 /DNA_START=1 /DNA_END=1833 /DNA_ORIENTATION=-